MNENEVAMSRGVDIFLQSIGLQGYISSFLHKGYDRETDLHHIGEEDLDEMCITNPSHRRDLLSAAKKHKVSEESKLLEWLRGYELEHYFIGFIGSELVDLDDIARLSLPDVTMYDELEMTMLGHQRRLERAVRQLNKRRKIGDSDLEVPVAEGFWGKPTNLDDAKYDFLCVEATVTSTRDSSRRHTIDFMVDSGSDVTTLHEDLLYTLNPELIGPINSKGVHSSRRKNLYRAKLTIGTQDLEIEVMGESYNSLGSRVLRHFRHYITGSKHIWLPGDFFDPTMSSALMKASRPDDSSETSTTHETGESSEKQSGETNTMTSQDTPMTSPNMPTTSHHTSTTSNCPEKIEDNIVHINQLDLIAHDNEIAERGPDHEVIASLGKDSGDSRDCAREQVLESSSGAVGEMKDNVDGKLSAHNGHILHNGATDS
ncbi:ankyrin repeat and SAM domain-containing protein 1A-like [Haliotis cracherodii]|uniref:ankyrin repeat and SAM domain-containing protein 1A-like n=1 Tax=Haliotis cracherodii TaxID=6455 RepID=UPI0039EA6BFB